MWNSQGVSLARPSAVGAVRSRVTPSLRRRAEERARLVQGFLQLRFGIAVEHHAAARLGVDHAVLHDGRAKRDAGVHVAAGAEIADAPRIDAALVLLHFV